MHTSSAIRHQLVPVTPASLCAQPELRFTWLHALVCAGLALEGQAGGVKLELMAAEDDNMMLDSKSRFSNADQRLGAHEASARGADAAGDANRAAAAAAAVGAGGASMHVIVIDGGAEGDMDTQGDHAAGAEAGVASAAAAAGAGDGAEVQGDVENMDNDAHGAAAGAAQDAAAAGEGDGPEVQGAAQNVGHDAHGAAAGAPQHAAAAGEGNGPEVQGAAQGISDVRHIITKRTECDPQWAACHVCIEHINMFWAVTGHAFALLGAILVNTCIQSTAARPTHKRIYE